MAETSFGQLIRALERFPRQRYPIKHAALQRRLSLENALAGQLDDAEHALRVALEIYGKRFPLDRAATLNSLGSVLRDQGRLEEAAGVFKEAEASLASSSDPAELGGITFNLGLVQRQLGDQASATDSFRKAASLLDETDHPAELGAAMRELGSAKLTSGDLEEAVAILQRSIDLAVVGEDRAGLGAATNLLGLTHLALGDPVAALGALAESASASPPTLRADAHAIAKANAALAFEALGDVERARQVAHQALSLSAASPTVSSQADSVLRRLGHEYDIHGILDSVEAGEWPGILGDEIRHWARWQPAQRRNQAMNWVTGLARRDGTSVERAEAFFGSLLELEPQAFRLLTDELKAVVSALPDEDATQFISLSSRAAARFRVPQMERLESALGLA